MAQSTSKSGNNAKKLKKLKTIELQYIKAERQENKLKFNMPKPQCWRGEESLHNAILLPSNKACMKKLCGVLLLLLLFVGCSVLRILDEVMKSEHCTDLIPLLTLQAVHFYFLFWKLLGCEMVPLDLVWLGRSYRIKTKQNKNMLCQRNIWKWGKIKE